MLPAWGKELLAENSSHGLLADGTQLTFYGKIKLPVRVWDVKAEEAFVASHISEDVILCMPFLRWLTIVPGQEAIFTSRWKGVDLYMDRHGRLLLSNI